MKFTIYKLQDRNIFHIYIVSKWELELVFIKHNAANTRLPLTIAQQQF